MSPEQAQIMRLFCYFVTAITSTATAGILLPSKDTLGTAFGLLTIAVVVNAVLLGSSVIGKILTGSHLFLGGLANTSAIFMALVSVVVLYRMWKIKVDR